MNFKFLFQLFFCPFLLAGIHYQASGQIRTEEYSVPMAGTSAVSEVLSTLNSNIDLPTGVGSVNIPIFELKANDLTIPVGLSYQTTGIRLTDINNGPLGFGWNLTGAGKITRIIRNSSDIRWPLEFSKTPEQVWGDVENYYAIRNFESDLYYFETPTVTGMFILGADMRPVTIPYQNVDIQWHSTDSEDGYFTITDNNGNKYVFGETSLTRENTTLQTHFTAVSGEKYTYTSTWFLDGITSLKGERIKYSYNTVAQTSYMTELSMYHYQRTGSNGQNKYWSEGTIKNETTIASPKVLAEISWGTNAKIKFSRSNGLITAINFTTSPKPAYNGDETIFFSYIKNSNGSLLNDIKKGSKTVYGFEYYNANDYAYRKAFDWWGFYNKVGHITNIPATKPTTGLYAPDKSPKLEYARYHTLKTIVMPDKGRQEYTYELNDGYTSQGTYMQAGGLRVAAIRTVSDQGKANTVRYEYKTADGRSSGVLFADAIRNYYETYSRLYTQYTRNYADIPYNELFDVNQRCVTYSTVREINGPTTIEYGFSSSLDDDAKDIPALIYHYHRDDPGQIIREPISVFNNQRPFDVGNIDFYNTSRFWRRGLLKRKRVFDEGMNLVLDQKYEYNFGNAPKQQVTNYQYYCNVVQVANGSFFEDTYICAYKWQQEIVTQKSVETLQGRFNPYSKTDYTYDQQYLVPVKEQSTDCLGNVVSTTTTYPFDYSNFSQADYDSPQAALQWLKDKKIAVPVETVCKKNGNLLKAELNEYRRSPYTYVLPHKTYELRPKSFAPAFSRYDGSASDSRYELKTAYCSYDNKGRLTGCMTDHNVQSMIYDDYSPAPIAKIQHALYDPYNDEVNQVFYNGFENDGEDLSTGTGHAKTGYRAKKGVYSSSAWLAPGTYCLTYWQSTDSGQTWTQTRQKFSHTGGLYEFSIGGSVYYVDEIRIHPDNAQMETFGYWPDMKKYTESDCNGKTSYFQYDAVGRLLRERDDNYDITAEYEYNTIVE